MTSNFPTSGDVTTVVRTAGTYARDLAERTAATFVVASGAVFVAAQPADMFTLSFWEGAATAGFAAAGTLVKGALGRLIGDKNSASVAPRV